jgi:hypothetical protein
LEVPLEQWILNTGGSRRNIFLLFNADRRKHDTYSREEQDPKHCSEEGEDH